MKDKDAQDRILWQKKYELRHLATLLDKEEDGDDYMSEKW